MLLQSEKMNCLKLERIQRNLCEKDRVLNESFKRGTRKIRKVKGMAKSLHSEISSLLNEFDDKMEEKENYSYLSDNNLSTCDSDRKGSGTSFKVPLPKGTKQEKLTFLNISRISYKKEKKLDILFTLKQK